MLAFRRLLARRVPALRFFSRDSFFDDFEALSIEDQIEEIRKRNNHLSCMIEICQSTINKKSEGVEKLFRETKKVPFEYPPLRHGYPLKAPDVEPMLKELEKWEDLKDFPKIDDCALGTEDVAKILKSLQTWNYLYNGFEEYYSPMRDVEENLTLLGLVRIIQARVNDPVKKPLENDKE